MSYFPLILLVFRIWFCSCVEPGNTFLHPTSGVTSTFQLDELFLDLISKDLLPTTCISSAVIWLWLPFAVTASGTVSLTIEWALFEIWLPRICFPLCTVIFGLINVAQKDALWCYLMFLLLILRPLSWLGTFATMPKLLTHLKCSLLLLSSSGLWCLPAIHLDSSFPQSAQHQQPALHLHCSGQSLRTRLRICAHCPLLDELLFGLHSVSGYWLPISSVGWASFWTSVPRH